MRVSTYTPTLLAAALAIGSFACGKVYEPEVEARTFELPAGTQLVVTSTRPLDFENLEVDGAFAGELAEPITDEGKVIAPIGSPVAGRVIEGTDADPIGIELTSITIVGGDEAVISTAPVFPRTPDDVDREITEDQRLAFVLDEAAVLSWAMDPSVDEEEL